MTVIEKEKKTIKFMISYYCKKIHKQLDLCEDCLKLIEYAYKKLDLCKYGNNKTNCKKCPTHCYSPENRNKIKKIMRFTGPRMIYLMPLELFKHLFG